MAQFQYNEGQGSLFLNNYKNFQDPNDRKPAYTGRVMVNGRLMNISAWVKATQDGQQFFSIQLSEPQPQQAAPQGGYQPQGGMAMPPQTPAYQQPQAPVYQQPYPPQAAYPQAQPQPQYQPQPQPQYQPAQPVQQPYPQQPYASQGIQGDMPEA